MIGAGVGSAVGVGTGKVATDRLKPVASDGVTEILGSVGSSLAGEVTGSKTQDTLDALDVHGSKK